MMHSVYGPSSASRWIRCPASVHHQDGSREPGPEALRGSAMHYVAEHCLVSQVTVSDEYTKKLMTPSDFIGELIDVDGDEVMFTENEVMFTEEMSGTVDEYLEYVQDLIRQFPDAVVSVEKQVSLEWFGAAYADVRGTADLIIDEKFGVLTVVDFKTGAGISVNPDSAQIKLYAIEAAGELLETYEEIRCVIIQPNDKFGEVYKEAVFAPEELLQWLTDEVIPAVEDSLSDNPTYNPSETACRWCDYAGKCPAQNNFALALADEQFSDFEVCEPVNPDDPSTIDADRMSYLLEQSKFIKNWIEAVEFIALARMDKGERIPGYKLIETEARWKWTSDVDIEKELYDKVKLKKKDILKVTVKTPKQILGVAPAIKYPLIEKLIIKPKGGLKIVPDDDKRQAVETEEHDGSEFDLFG